MLAANIKTFLTREAVGRENITTVTSPLKQRDSNRNIFVCERAFGTAQTKTASQW